MAALNEAVDLSVEDGVAVLTVNSPPVNALSAAVRTGMAEGLAQAAADPAVKAMALVCAGRTFIAGADISEFGKPPQGVSLLQVIDDLEALPKPLVAGVHGTALGGGLEVALACHYRIAVASAKLGLPEVKIGILPGAGGTQRLPRVVGVEKALAMVTSGDPIGAKEAHALGLVDEIAPEDGLRAAAIAFARRAAEEGWPLVKVRDRTEKIEAARGKPEIFAAFRKANARKFRGFAAPENNIRAIEAAVNLPFEEGVREERRLFMELFTGPQAAAQRYVFFAERQVWKIPDISEDAATIPVKKVGVVGAGTMGGGIAMNFANVGLPVVLLETSREALDRGLAVVRKNYEAAAMKGRMSEADVEARMGLLTGTLDYGDFADCDLVIEAVFETMAVKKEVFAKLDQVAKQGAILATNTSALDINEIAASIARPEAVIGLHFFSPANVMRLLEVVRAEKTARTAIATSMQLAKKIGKIAALVRVCPGFVGNRMLFRRQAEASRLLLEGAMPWEVDQALYDFGFPMGPFAMSDLAGLDIGWSKETSSRSTIREALCELGRRGQKTGAGFYDYDEARNATPSPVTAEIVEEFRAKAGGARRTIGAEEIVERCIYPMIDEGARILEEGIAIRASDIDVIWINGYGWPVYRGGPMYFADQLGAAVVAERLRAFGMEPSPLLAKLAAEGGRFQDFKG